MTSKQEPTERVATLISKQIDVHGNKVTHVLASQNEFVIYEIDTPDINNKLKVLIDGHSNESERKIINRFDKVKQEYVKAKGLLYRSPNIGMMKNRVAHSLATCLGCEDDKFDGVTLFRSLCVELEKEQKRTIINRFFYLLPSLISVVAAAIAAYAFHWQRADNTAHWQMASAFLAASLGTSASMLTGVKKLHFEEFPLSGFYALLGTERVFFGLVVGAIAYIAIKSGLITSSILQGSYWASLMVLVAAGFSEHFAPSIIKKIEA
ncbi:MAG: hypothetical protein E2593_09340 [Stenotrophomonas sp.]|nr:hypothetical protein [Stenotrophomonas sp.]